MEASVVWQGGMEFQGSADSGHTITLDAAPDVGGQDHGLRPMELMALSWLAARRWTSFRS